MTETKLHIVDYGVGNLGSVGRALRRLDVSFELTANAERIADASRILLPGVGHFGESMSNLRERGLEEAVQAALKNGGRLLGICVGFQMLFESSEEAPGIAGLGLLEGDVRHLPKTCIAPHIGWNQLGDVGPSPLLEGIDEGDYFYFLHSYYAAPSKAGDAWALTDYGTSFCSVAGRGAVSGIQFHPEKSQKLGLRVLRNFCEAP